MSKSIESNISHRLKEAYVIFKSILLFSSALLLFSLSSCDSGLFGDDDMTEEEWLASCKAALETPPEVKEFYHQNEDDPLSDSRNGGSSSLLVEKKENVWRVIVKPSVNIDPEVFPDPVYVSSFTDSLWFDAATLPVDNSDPENEYWIIDVRFPATNLNFTYDVYYQCEDEQLSDATIIELQTPDICAIHPLWEVWSEPIGSAGNTSGDQKIVEWSASFRPAGESYTMAFFPYDKISFKAYVTSGSYTYVYENVLEAFRVPDHPGQMSLPEYINFISLQIDLHELTGISEQEWQTWTDQVTIEVEFEACGEKFLPRGYEPNSRVLLTWWNPTN